MEIKSQYEKFQKKYDLPNYEKLDEEFELLYIHNIIEIKPVLRFVRRRIADKLNWAIIFLHGIVQPNPSSLVSMEENKFFTDKEKEEIIKILKELASIERKNFVLDLEHKEEDDAKFIKENVKRWEEIKKKLLEYGIKIQEEWKKETNVDKKEHYFG